MQEKKGAGCIYIHAKKKFEIYRRIKEGVVGGRLKFKFHREESSATIARALCLFVATRAVCFYLVGQLKRVFLSLVLEFRLSLRGVEDRAVLFNRLAHFVVRYF